MAEARQTKGSYPETTRGLAMLKGGNRYRTTSGTRVLPCYMPRAFGTASHMKARQIHSTLTPSLLQSRTVT